VPASFDVLGVANGTNNVTVNGSPADYRRGEYFQEVVNVANSSTAVWQGVAVTNTYTGAYEIGHVFVPKTPEVFRHDLDGNLTNDGRWKFVWDPENRLVKLVADSGVGPQHWIAFQYDWRGRRVAKSIGPIGSEEATNTVKFIYDDWNLIAILDSESSVLESFSWGSDLSGSMQGAGGVGGLLFVSNPSGGMHFPSFDGNGNVMALVSAQDASLSAQYEYGPFGETIRATGPMSAANPFRFSTKFQDEETTLLYYGYRYYASSTGSWISRDPIEEKGFTRFFRITSPLHGKAAKTRKDQLSLYAIAGNALIGSYDVLGLLSDAGNNYSSAYCCPEVANWITCSEICKLALRDYKINPTIAGGGVVCYHGKACGCLGALRLVGYYPGECPQIDEVIRYHEDQHAPKADCSKCGFYRMAKWKDGVDDTQEECEQRKESLRRLISIKDNLDEKCQSVAITLIGLLVDQTKDCPPTEE
jgi:RHS repeat-associated protein